MAMVYTWVDWLQALAPFHEISPMTLTASKWQICMSSKITESKKNIYLYFFHVSAQLTPFWIIALFSNVLFFKVKSLVLAEILRKLSPLFRFCGMLGTKEDLELLLPKGL